MVDVDGFACVDRGSQHIRARRPAAHRRQGFDEPLGPAATARAQLGLGGGGGFGDARIGTGGGGGAGGEARRGGRGGEVGATVGAAVGGAGVGGAAVGGAAVGGKVAGSTTATGTPASTQSTGAGVSRVCAVYAKAPASPPAINSPPTSRPRARFTPATGAGAGSAVSDTISGTRAGASTARSNTGATTSAVDSTSAGGCVVTSLGAGNGTCIGVGVAGAISAGGADTGGAEATGRENIIAVREAALRGRDTTGGAPSCSASSNAMRNASTSG